MNFVSLAFLLPFAAVAALHRALPARRRWVLLLAASAAFYLLWHPGAALLLGAVVLLTYACARGIAAAQTPRRRKALLALALTACLGCLAVFKYCGFFVENAFALLHLFGLATGQAAPAVRLLLPVGISFYTFQTLSYVLDVYHGKLAPERHLGYYALFVCFFPQLVAGPIERPQHLLPQLRAGRPATGADLWAGLCLLLRGYFKKLVLADFAAPLVDAVYRAPGNANGPAVLLATVLFALQIYCDFAGYSDIACGAARMVGIRLVQNFNAPYLAHSIRDFWRRWHISLTTWLTDYLYIPLGGSRCGKARHCLNILLVFCFSGLWHGAGWHFVAWGALHGLYMAAAALHPAVPPATPVRLWLCRLRTFALVCLAWVFFRAQSIPDALRCLWVLPTGWDAPGLAAAAALLALTPWMALRLGFGVAALALLRRLPRAAQGMAPARQGFLVFSLSMAVALAWLGLAAGDGASAFLYFQF